MPVRHFLSLADLSDSELMKIINRGIEMKQLFGKGVNLELLRHRTAVMIFEKSSTRTRVSFETGVTHLGGNVIFLSPNDSQLGRGETVEDAARVLSRLASLIIVRTGSHARLARLAEFASVPVINGLSDYNHPCQLLADLQTWVEHRGDIKGRVAAWVGDGNNVCHSWMNAARLLGFQLRIATPDGYQPDPGLVAECAGSITLTSDPVVAVTNADVVITDTWASMGQEEEKKKREPVFGAFQVNSALMREAKPDALFMHCLPAYRGMEVSEDVLEGEQSVVWDEAENRLHAQKALMEFLLIESAR